MSTSKLRAAMETTRPAQGETPTGMGGDGRTGSSTVTAAVEQVCTPMSLSSSSSSDTAGSGSAFCDCRGQADELAALAS